MILGAMAFIAGICAMFSGLRAFVVPGVLIGLVVFVVASVVRWRTASGPTAAATGDRANGHVETP
jgi:hypothetical protein